MATRPPIAQWRGMGQEFKKVKMVAHRASQCLRARARRCVCGSRSARRCVKSNKKWPTGATFIDAVLLSADIGKFASAIGTVRPISTGAKRKFVAAAAFLGRAFCAGAAECHPSSLRLAL